MRERRAGKKHEAGVGLQCSTRSEGAHCNEVRGAARRATGSRCKPSVQLTACEKRQDRQTHLEGRDGGRGAVLELHGGVGGEALDRLHWIANQHRGHTQESVARKQKDRLPMHTPSKLPAKTREPDPRTIGQSDSKAIQRLDRCKEQQGEIE